MDAGNCFPKQSASSSAASVAVSTPTSSVRIAGAPSSRTPCFGAFVATRTGSLDRGRRREAELRHTQELALSFPATRKGNESLGFHREAELCHTQELALSFPATRKGNESRGRENLEGEGPDEKKSSHRAPRRDATRITTSPSTSSPTLISKLSQSTSVASSAHLRTLSKTRSLTARAKPLRLASAVRVASPAQCTQMSVLLGFPPNVLVQARRNCSKMLAHCLHNPHENWATS